MTLGLRRMGYCQPARSGLLIGKRLLHPSESIVKQAKTILLVDDEPSIRMVLRAVLEHAGYDVEVAEDGYVALHKISEFLPDLVITDLRMPNMNGFELLAVLRSRYPEIPTIAISGEFLVHDLSAVLIADAFFQKGNYSPPELHTKIEGSGT